MIKVAIKKRYKIGPFIISINFDDEEFAEKVIGQLSYVCPTVKNYEINSEYTDCECSIFLHTDYLNGVINKTAFDAFDNKTKYCIRKGNHYVTYSADFRTIEVFLDKADDAFPYVFGNIWRLDMFVPFFLDNGAIILHAAGVIYKGKGFIFAGPSGIGKTTICKALATYENVQILSDERVLIHSKKDASIVHPSWIYSQEGKDLQEKAFDGSVPIRALFFLQQSKEFAMKELSFREQIKKVYQHAVLFYPATFQSQETNFPIVYDIAKNSSISQLFYDRSKRIFSLLASFL